MKTSPAYILFLLIRRPADQYRMRYGRNPAKQGGGYTFIEVLLAGAILAIVSLGSFFYLNKSGSNQALSASAENVATITQQAHIFSREIKDFKTWGVASSGNLQLNLVYYIDSPADVSIEKSYKLEKGVTFGAPFTVYFEKGTGNPQSPATIILTNNNNQKLNVEILTSGVIEVVSP